MIIVKTVQEGRQDLLHTVGAQCGEASFGSVQTRLSDISTRVAEAGKELRDELNDIGFEHTAKDQRKQFVGKESTLALVDFLLVLRGATKGRHDAIFFDDTDTLAADDACKTVCSTSLCRVLLGLQKLF